MKISLEDLEDRWIEFLVNQKVNFHEHGSYSRDFAAANIPPLGREERKSAHLVVYHLFRPKRLPSLHWRLSEITSPFFGKVARKT
jgi:hypothetical protein